MAFTTDNIIVGGDIEVIVKKDSAIDHDLSDYDKYLDTIDESHLVFKHGDEPTRFVMKKDIALKHSIKIDNQKIRYEKGGDVSVNLGSLVTETVRATLIGIKNPSGVPEEKQLKIKTHEGLLDEKQTEMFLSAGIIENLYTARENYIKKMGGSEDLKKD